MDIWAPGRGGSNEAHVSTKQHSTQANPRVSQPHGDTRRPRRTQATASQGAEEADRQHSAEATALTTRARLPRHARVRSRREYLALQRDGRRQTTPHFVLLARPRSDARSRLGITVSRKVGNAVTRNYVKRCVREWFRHQRRQIVPALDLVVIARPGAADLNCTVIAAELTKSLSAGKRS